MCPKARSLKHAAVTRELERLTASLSEGDRLPPERELAREFDCNPLTVRKAMAPLVDAGVLVRRVGSGTFVARRGAPVAPDGATRVGVLIHADADAYAHRVAHRLAEAAQHRDVTLRSSWVRDLGDAALARATQLRREGCGAVVVPWIPANEMSRVAEFARSSPVPAVLPVLIPGLEKHCFEKPGVHGTNNIRATEAAFRYFRLLGHKRIAYLGPDVPEDLTLQRNLGGYTSSAAREGLEQMCGLVGPRVAHMDALAKTWARHRGELAVICYDDTHALRFVTAMHKRSRSAPGDFAILGHNDIDEARYADPPLSSVAARYDQIASRLLASAVAMAGGAVKQSATGPGLRLIVRRSCGGASRANGRIAAAMKKLGVTVERDETMDGAEP